MNGYELAAQKNRQHQWQMWAEFAEHQLGEEAYWQNGYGARWVVRRPGQSFFYAEIIAGAGGSLVVHGDIDVVRFAHYGDHADCWSRLRWIAHGTDLDYYIAQKATIGGACEGLVYDDEVTTQCLRDELRGARESDDKDEADALVEALDRVDDGHHAVMEALWGAGLYKVPIARVVAPRVICAHAALNRCVSLLWEKYGFEGPPGARSR